MGRRWGRRQLLLLLVSLVSLVLLVVLPHNVNP